MNKEEILAMEAGLELDMLVGQYVIKFEDYLKESGKRPVVRDGRYGKNYFDMPNYSTDISAAWEVLEKFYQYEIKKTKVSWTGMEWFSIWLWKDESNKSVYEFNFKTAQEAICKAALLAVTNS